MIKHLVYLLLMLASLPNKGVSQALLQIDTLYSSNGEFSFTTGFKLHRDTILVGTSKGDIYATYNRGHSWNQLYDSRSHPGDEIVRVSRNSLGHILASRKNFGIIRSVDDGATWTSSIIAENYEGYFDIGANNIIVTGLVGSIGFSYDHGETWSHKQITSDPTDRITGIAIRDSVILVGIDPDLFDEDQIGEVYVSYDLGNLWTKDLVLPSLPTVLNIDNSGAMYAGGYTGETGSGLHIKRTNTSSWNLVAPQLPEEVNERLVTAFDRIHDFILYGSFTDLYYSNSAGEDWTSIGYKFSFITNIMSISRNEHIIVDQKYIFKIENFKITASEHYSRIPFREKVEIYPNPTNGIINVNTTGGNGSIAVIEIIDLSGRLIQRKTFAAQETGRNAFSVDISSNKMHSSGVYLVRITIENNTYHKIISMIK